MCPHHVSPFLTSHESPSEDVDANCRIALQGSDVEHIFGDIMDAFADNERINRCSGTKLLGDGYTPKLREVA